MPCVHRRLTRRELKERQLCSDCGQILALFATDAGDLRCRKCREHHMELATVTALAR